MRVSAVVVTAAFIDEQGLGGTEGVEANADSSIGISLCLGIGLRVTSIEIIFFGFSLSISSLHLRLRVSVIAAFVDEHGLDGAEGVETDTEESISLSVRITSVEIVFFGIGIRISSLHLGLRVSVMAAFVDEHGLDGSQRVEPNAEERIWLGVC